MEFDCEIIYKKGLDNVRADILSRIRHPDITDTIDIAAIHIEINAILGRASHNSSTISPMTLNY